MLNYKKIVKNKESRFKILRYLRFVPDSWMLKFQYRIKLRRKLNIKNPKRFSEKLQWYKINYQNPLLTECADKYKARNYIKSKGLEDILVKLYAVNDNPDQIKLNDLPESFVIKTTNGSGTNIICRQGESVNIENLRQNLSAWLKRDNFSVGREWSYKDIKPRIIIEEYLEDSDSSLEGINDYKFICFNGNPKYVVFDVDRHTNHKRNIYDANWNYVDVSTDYQNFGDVVPKPDGYDEMLRIAKILAEDFPFVRVDLYYVNKKVYFGELTFYPWTGYIQFDPDEFDYKLGKQFSLKE